MRWTICVVQCVFVRWLKSSLVRYIMLVFCSVYSVYSTCNHQSTPIAGLFFESHILIQRSPQLVFTVATERFSNLIVVDCQCVVQTYNSKAVLRIWLRWCQLAAFCVNIYRGGRRWCYAAVSQYTMSGRSLIIHIVAWSHTFM